MKSQFSDVKGHIISTDIGIGGYKDSQIGIIIDVELDEDNRAHFRFFDGCWLAENLEDLDQLQLRQYARLVTKLHSMLENSGADSLIDLVGIPVDVRISGNTAVAFRFADSQNPWPHGMR